MEKTGKLKNYKASIKFKETPFTMRHENYQYICFYK